MSAESSEPQPVELSADEKLRLLNDHRVGADDPPWQSLDDTRWCLHCAKVFTGHSVRVYRDNHFRDGYSLECGTPGCNGTPLDWDLPDSDFARGVTAQYKHADLMQMRDKPVPEHEPAPPVEDPDYEDTGVYGPELSVVPDYQDEAQRKRLWPLLWREPAAGQDEDSGHPEFLRALCQGAKAGMRQAYTVYLQEPMMAAAQLAFPARATAMASDDEDPDDIVPEEFRVEVEYGDYEETGVAPLVPSLSAFDELLYRVANERATEQFLVRALRSEIAEYLAKHGAAAENLEWEIRIEGFGG